MGGHLDISLIGDMSQKAIESMRGQLAADPAVTPLAEAEETRFKPGQSGNLDGRRGKNRGYNVNPVLKGNSAEYLVRRLVEKRKSAKFHQPPESRQHFDDPRTPRTPWIVRRAMAGLHPATCDSVR